MPIFSKDMTYCHRLETTFCQKCHFPIYKGKHFAIVFLVFLPQIFMFCHRFFVFPP